jgi:hypothetical protein
MVDEIAIKTGKVNKLHNCRAKPIRGIKNA